MKIAVKSKIVTLSLFVWSVQSHAQNTSLAQMNDLLEKRDFFSLKKELSVSNPSLTQQDSLYFQASVQNTFGNNAQSIAAIKTLSENFATKVDDNAWINLLNILADDYIKIYDYKSAAASYAILLKRYGNRLSQSDVAGYENNYSLYKSLEHVPAHTVQFLNSEPVVLSKDQQELWNVPIVVNQKDSARFIFDSGAGFSTITTSAANRLGVRIIPTSIKINSANDKKVDAQLGIAEEIKMGGAIFHNVVFLVIADEALQFPAIDYRIEGIIGFPVISSMRNITITRKGLLYINQSENNSSKNANFYYQGNAIRILGFNGKDSMFFHLDTGAKQSELNKEYYDANSAYVRSVSEKRKYKLGGAGGVTSYKTFQLPNFSLQIGSGKKTLPYIPVYPNKVSPYGNAIGQDFIQLFEKMTIDFDNCHINFQ